MVDIANFLAQNSPRFNRAAIDRQHFGNALMENDVSRIPQYNRQQDQQIQAQDQQINDVQRKNAAGVLGRNFSIAAQSPRPRDAARALISSPDFQTAGKLVGLPVEQFTITDQDTDDTIRQQLQTWAQALGSAVESPKHYEQVAGPDGSFFQVDTATGQMQPLLSREPREAQPRQSEPPVAVLGPDGRPVYVSREQSIGRTPYEKPTGGLSPRDASTARNKLTQIGLARQQVALAREKFNAIQGSFSAGPGGQFVPTQAGQAFDAAVDTMRSTITGIMRVPGVGSMSDYESRLDQAKIPSRGKYENTTAQQLDSLDQMLNQLEQGYSGLISDNGGQLPSAPTSQQQQPQQQAPAEAIQFLQQHPELAGAFQAKYGYLP